MGSAMVRTRIPLSPRAAACALLGLVALLAGAALVGPVPAHALAGSTQAAAGHGASGSSGKLSTTAIIAAAVAALIALGALAWGIARMRAYEPRWTLSLRHSMAEAGFRASATWAEFSDWIRTGH
jgi:hypothetical protein